MTENNTEKYISVLPKVMETYNNRHHRMILMPPVMAEIKSNWSKVRLNQEKTKYSTVKRRKPKFKIGIVIFL